MKGYLSIACIVAASVLLSGCVDDNIHGSSNGFSLKGVYESFGTKSVPFGEGDKYHIYAYETDKVNNSNLSSPYIDSDATETDGAIKFPSSVETLFGGRTLNFYGVTVGESGPIESALDKRTINGIANKPVFALVRTDGRLKDLRRAVLPSQSSVNSGEIVLPFKHALSKINFTITRQDVPELVGATLESVSIWDYDSALYDIIAGEWRDTTGVDRNQVEIFSRDPYNGLAIMTDEDLKDQDNKGKDKVASALVFPRPETSGSIDVNVKVRVPHSTDLGVIANDYLLEVNTKLPLDQIPGGKGLQQNYEFTFSLAVVNNNIKIIMVLPTMYDWIEGATGLTGDIPLGQPITFGGVTWADRNLGAESATYNNVQEWDQMRGYFYQYGRSIPYFVLPTNTKNIGGVDKEYVYTPAYNKDNAATYNPYLAGFPLINSTSKQDAIDAVTAFAGSANFPGGKWQSATAGSTTYYYTGNWASLGATYPLGYHASNSVSNLAYEAHEWETSAWSDVTSAEKKRYLIVVGGADDNLPWWTGTRGSKENAPDTWTDKEKNPCPKGWKVPSKDDWAGIMPLSKRTGDITFSNGENNARNKPVGSAYNDDTGLNSYYDWDNNGTPTHQFRGNTGNANNTYTYHAFGNKDNWHKTAWFNAGYEQIYVDDKEPNEDYYLWWHEVGGQFKISQTNLKEDLGDPSEGYITHYLCVENKHDADYRNVDSPLASMRFYQGTLYAIKCQGTSQAYRLRWRYITLKGGNYVPVSYYNSADKYPVVLEICRYPATDEDFLEKPSDLKKWDDWDYPTETIVFPIGGYLFSEAPILTNNALESNYAAADHDGDGYFYYVRMKHSTSAASRYLMLFRMRRSYGMSIRCVKDNTVTLD
ncbi:MAG: fimbrillin family protein [Bacteroidales bacterium]|nr:fimbrillin family protein [Bacteroidales bacterium]